MSLKEWLPVTPRNRVALVFAGFSLVVFVIWNCVPVSDPWGVSPERMFCKSFWPLVFSVDPYLYSFKNPEFESFMALAAIISIAISSVTTILIIPFWRFCHAASGITLTVAISSLLGGLILLIFLLDAGGSDSSSVALALIAVNMLLTSAALLIFENELDWKPRKLDPRVSRLKSD
ncbi:MAG: hypothetical protein ACSHX9_04590 [Luteolibacter sp.]